MSHIRSPELRSLLDLLVQPLGQKTEATYSAPFANHLFIQSTLNCPMAQDSRLSAFNYVHGNLTDIFFSASLGVGLGL